MSVLTITQSQNAQRVAASATPLETLVRHTFTTAPGRALLREAITTYQVSSGAHHKRHRVLAQVGDAVLRTVVMLNAYTHKNWEKSDVEHYFQTIGTDARLVTVARERNLLPMLILPSLPADGKAWAKYVAGAVEALIGAVFIDSGFDLHAAQSTMVGLGLLPDHAVGAMDVRRTRCGNNIIGETRGI